MSQLPPFVIVHGKKDFGVDSKGKTRPLYLTATGWGPMRRDAVSFETHDMARDWISEVEKTLPRLISGVFPVVMNRPYEPKIDEGSNTMACEYDPYEVGN